MTNAHLIQQIIDLNADYILCWGSNGEAPQLEWRSKGIVLTKLIDAGRDNPTKWTLYEQNGQSYLCPLSLTAPVIKHPLCRPMVKYRPRPKKAFWPIYPLVRACLLLFAVLSVKVMHGQTLPPAPQPHHLPKIDWALSAGDAGARGLDTYSTRWFITHHYGHELLLPEAVADHTPALVAVEGGAVTLDYFAARYLGRRGHHRLAEVWLIADAACVTPWAVHNLYLSDPTSAKNPIRLPRLPGRL